MSMNIGFDGGFVFLKYQFYLRLWSIKQIQDISLCWGVFLPMTQGIIFLVDNYGRAKTNNKLQ